MDAGTENIPSTLDDFDLPTTKSALESELSASVSKKRGHVCCGCCCDTRRAVLAIDSFQFVATLIMSILVVVGKEVVQWAASLRLDDNVLQQDQESMSQMPVGRLLLFWGCQMFLYSCGVIGAIQFHPPLIYASLLAYLVGLGIATWYGHVVSMGLNLISIYPHIVFLKEMKSLIMTPENYPNEVHSFCCVQERNVNVATIIGLREIE